MWARWKVKSGIFKTLGPRLFHRHWWGKKKKKWLTWWKFLPPLCFLCWNHHSIILLCSASCKDNTMSIYHIHYPKPQSTALLRILCFPWPLNLPSFSLILPQYMNSQYLVYPPPCVCIHTANPHIHLFWWLS